MLLLFPLVFCILVDVERLSSFVPGLFKYTQAGIFSGSPHLLYLPSPTIASISGSSMEIQTLTEGFEWTL